MLMVDWNIQAFLTDIWYLKSRFLFIKINKMSELTDDGIFL